MSRRFAVTSFIVISSVLIGFFVYVLMLFLLPGVNLLGLKYIAWNKRYIHEPNKLVISDAKNSEGVSVGTYSGIVLNTYEIPVEVVFSTSVDVAIAYIDYLDNFNGITTSTEINYPSVTFEKNASTNNVEITVSEYHKFLYETKNSERRVQIMMPMETMKNSANWINLEINSVKSDITFKIDANGYRTPAQFSNLKIKTNGNVKYEYNVEVANTYTYETSQSIEIDENLKTTVKSKNYNLTSTTGKIVVKTPVEGDLTCTTKLGKVLVNECKGNFTASTSFGDVGYYGEDEGGVLNVKGNVSISTKAGNVTLGEVKGNNLNSISTTSGCITITKIKDGTIKTQRGMVNITSVNSFDIQSTTGQIYIQEAKQNLTVNTTRGKVKLGGQKMLMNNITVNSVLGDVEVMSVSGKVVINAIESDVKFTNEDSTDINITSCNLVAEKLKGDVTVYVKESIERMSFDSLNEGDVEITLGEKCKNATIYFFENQEFEDTAYDITGKEICVESNDGLGNWNQEDLKTDIYNEGKGDKSFTLKSNNAKINLRYYKYVKRT